jgi:hypothetical protein
MFEDVSIILGIHHLSVWDWVSHSNVLMTVQHNRHRLDLSMFQFKLLGKWGTYMLAFTWLSFQLHFVQVWPCFIQGNDSIQICITFVSTLALSMCALPHLDLRQSMWDPPCCNFPHSNNWMYSTVRELMLMHLASSWHDPCLLSSSSSCRWAMWCWSVADKGLWYSVLHISSTIFEGLCPVCSGTVCQSTCTDVQFYPTPPESS